MELIEIIKSSLSIFSTTAFVFITVSYTIFKIKDHSRVKPYLRVDIQNPLSSKLNDKRGVVNNVNMKKKTAEENQFNNMVLVKLPVQNRFKIINGDVTVAKLTKPGNRKENSIHRLKPNDDEKNIYDFFVIPDEKIHKLNLVTR